MNRRKPLQIGFGITLGVFLSLMGLIIFERIIVLGGMVLTGYEDDAFFETFLYGAETNFSPWDAMAFALIGLLFAQCFQAYKAISLKLQSWLGILFGSCNIAMIGLLGLNLAINWAYFNPAEPVAYSINSLSRHIDTGYYETPETIARREYDPQLGWEHIDDLTQKNKSMDLVVRWEIIKRYQTIESQKLNTLARRPDANLALLTEGIYARHYYDLEGNLLTIDATPNWPRVKDKLEAAGRKAWDEDGLVYQRFNALEDKRPRHQSMTYEEILALVEASWEGISLEELGEAEDPPTPNSNPE